jgi:hypothetical protein
LMAVLVRVKLPVRLRGEVICGHEPLRAGGSWSWIVSRSRTRCALSDRYRAEKDIVMTNKTRHTLNSPEPPR